jgi:hypothetical protein
MVENTKLTEGKIIMSEYVFLYRGGDRGASPEVMQQRMQRWMAWMKELGEKGHIKDQGQPLERSGKLVKGKEKTVTDGPFAEAKDVVGGYTLILARDLDQAVELSKGCPIFESDNGAVEVRPVMKMSV